MGLRVAAVPADHQLLREEAVSQSTGAEQAALAAQQVRVSQWCVCVFVESRENVSIVPNV